MVCVLENLVKFILDKKTIYLFIVYRWSVRVLYLIGYYRWLNLLSMFSTNWLNDCFVQKIMYIIFHIQSALKHLGMFGSRNELTKKEKRRQSCVRVFECVV